MNTKFKILYVEHVAGDAALVYSILKKAQIDCDIQSVNNKENYLSALINFVPHIVLADDALPGLGAITALNLLKEKGLSIPLIVFTTPGSDNIAANIVNIMKQGAFDYILKDHIEALPDAVICAIKKHRADANLLLSEQRYKQIVETAQEGIWIIDENLVTVFLNKKMCDILGYSTEEIMGKHNYDFKDTNEKIHTIERIEQRKLGIMDTHESTFISKSGKLVTCAVATNILFDTDGRYLGTLAMMTDITQRKANEDALKRSEANLSAIIENTTDLVYSLDKDLNFITYNQIFKNVTQQVYGFNIEQGINTMDMLRGFDVEMAAKWENIYARALAGEAMQFVNEYDFGDGKVYLNYSINPIWETGKVIGLSCFSRDITMQKLNEVEREKITTDLLQRNKALEQFTYILSHNLRAPVANIIGLSSLIAGIETENNDVGKIVSSINLSANKLDEVISDLNRILQVNEGKNENIESIILSALVENIQSSIRYLIEKEQVIIKYDFTANDELLSLKSFIHSIFYNLILNSIKYRKPGVKPIIHISTQINDDKTRIIFSDNGRGIDTSKYANEIFGLYKRFDTTVEGKGMGLFMVKMQVETLGGTISLQSELNKGTQFIIDFPQIQTIITPFS